ncbi:hypothetical protein QMO14_30190, partial [Variovorax sp. CAN2819]|uniref:hypothetical protein n=1 Tax=Variovorax sp. CAN15 TaxID=3046727 RepID=UPI002649564E
HKLVQKLFIQYQTLREFGDGSAVRRQRQEAGCGGDLTYQCMGPPCRKITRLGSWMTYKRGSKAANRQNAVMRQAIDDLASCRIATRKGHIRDEVHVEPL